MSNQKVYWKGLEELHETPEFVKSRDNEFVESLPMEEFLGKEEVGQAKTGRRDFLKFLGFSVTAAAVAACETPITKSLPYVIKPENITPGIPNYYASAYFDDNDFANILVKTREGRPIFIESGNPMVLTRKGLSAKVSASVLGLYDTTRLQEAKKKGNPIKWEDADKEIMNALNEIVAAGKRTAVLTSTIISPSTKKAIGEMMAKYGNIDHVVYDPVSYDGIWKANASVNGKAVIPTYRFDKALAVATFGADFLGTWLDHNAYEGDFAKTRNPKMEMSRLFAFEAVMSLTGANADYRSAVKHSEIAHALIHLYNKITGASLPAGKLSCEAEIAKCADYLKSKKGKALVVCGLNDPNAQIIAAEINKALEANGNTIDMDLPVYLKQGDSANIDKLFKDIAGGNTQGILLYNANPAYHHPSGEKVKEALSKIKLSVSFSSHMDESAESCTYTLPDHHYLESWNDFNPFGGHFAVSQPTIHPLFNTRQAQESFLVWAGKGSRTDKNSTLYREYMKTVWRDSLQGKQSKYTTFDDFWNYSVHDGGFESTGPFADSVSGYVSTPVSTESAAAALAAMYKPGSTFEVVLYQKIGIGTGNQANNPWLQEFPDPISRVTWDNYVTMSHDEMKELGYNTLMGQEEPADMAEVTVNGKTLKLPVIASPGQARGTIGIAVGYGRKFGKEGQTVGQNAFPLASLMNGQVALHAFGATLKKTGEKYPIASTQTHHTMMGRDIVKETSLPQYKENPHSGNHKHSFHTKVKNLKGKETHGHLAADEADFWKKFDRPNHNWGMTIDLNACNGCGACVIACHAENNVPVVGKDEIRRVRDMHWLRIDRYYSSDTGKEKLKNAKGFSEYKKANLDAEVPSSSPQVVFQPVMCQHCSQAPCETVCPVLATTHSNEGLNQMTYNRCIGTRYCANNCPYKVRRFNWFKYHDNEKFDFYMNDDLGKMVLNPDVTVRSRGVMEKCSMCVQRIQYGKLTAKKEGRSVKDGEIQTACQTACPTHAITFGDYNDESSLVRSFRSDDRSYALLEEVGTEPNVFYQVKVRNVDEAYYHGDEAAHGTEEHAGGHGDNHGKEGAHDH
jgi:molybdopterin-containing oxidoreductase family iron-sulfur binding subunit